MLCFEVILSTALLKYWESKNMNSYIESSPHCTNCYHQHLLPLSSFRSKSKGTNLLLLKNHRGRDWLCPPITSVWYSFGDPRWIATGLFFSEMGPRESKIWFKDLAKCKSNPSWSSLEVFFGCTWSQFYHRLGTSTLRSPLMNFSQVWKGIKKMLQ